ncbi:MAG TPA: WG repeat-containing protein [Pyrinomonadaceae bacterium]|nr:WG repeat-containing protein [Pyrinomonadaceae bacterium]
MSPLLKRLVLCVVATSILTAPSIAQDVPSENAPRRLFPVVNSIDGFLGYIDAEGSMVIPPEWSIEGGSPYDTFPKVSFSEGLAPFFENEKYGYIDEQGQTVISPQFEKADAFSEGLALVMMLRSRPGERDKDLTFSYINRKGEVVIELPPKFSTLPPDHYDTPRRFKDGYTLVYNEETSLFGFINKLGRVEIEPRFTDARHFSDGYAAVAVYERWGFIDKQGNHIVKPTYNEVGDFSEGLAGVKLKNGRLGFIDSSGKLVMSTRYRFPIDAGLFKPSARWGFRCEAGVSLDGAYLPAFAEGLYPVAVNGKWGFIDKTAKMVVAPRFDAVAPFKDGIAAIRIGRQYNFIDTRGKYIFRRSYPFVSSFRNGLALVFLQWLSKEHACGTNDKIVYAYIDRKGKPVFVGNYEYREQFGGDEMTGLPGVVDLRIESDPEGATIYLVPWTVWKFQGDESIKDDMWLQPANTSNTFSVQQQPYMVVLKLAGMPPWKRRIDVTDSTRNVVRWTRSAK